jgi:hypothetical protein
LNLGEQQKRDLVTLREETIRKQAELFRRRSEISVRMHELCNLPMATFELRDNIVKSLRNQDAWAELRQNFTDMFATWRDFFAASFGQILEPEQFARACVQSYPLFPDTFAIAACAAEMSKTGKTSCCIQQPAIGNQRPPGCGC